MTSKINRYFGPALLRVRTRLGISQYQLAKESGILETYLNKLENSKCEPRATMIIRLGRGLGIMPGLLLDEMELLIREAEAATAAATPATLTDQPDEEESVGTGESAQAKPESDD